MRIVHYTDHIDLRTIVSQRSYLHARADQLNLKNGDAAVFTNKAETRFRLIFKIRDIVLLCSPEIDDRDKYSLYLKLSEEFTGLAGLKATKVRLALLSDATRTRMHAAEVRKAAAARQQQKS